MGENQSPPPPPSYAPRSRSKKTGDTSAHASTHSSADASHTKAATTTQAAPTKQQLTGRRKWKKARSALSILVVMLTSGVVFGVAASNTRGQASSSDIDLVSMVRSKQATVEQLTDDRTSLRESINTYVGTGQQDDDTSEPDGTPSSIPVGTNAAVQGPGVTVTLTDAPPDQLTPEGAQPDDLVIHQQDIEDVMNALWRGGAEAMTVQGKRVTSRSVIRCIGNVILVDGTSYSPPYAISAIGDPDRLKRAVNSDERIVNYKRYVVKYGLGWRLDEESELTFTALPEDASPQYAHIVEDHG